MSESGLIGGKYGLVRQIGTGVLGGVWEAEEESASRRVALKLMTCPTEELVGRILDEARNARSVSHPNLTKIFDVGETRSSEPFVVMELLSGETLSDRLARERRLPAELAAKIGRDVAQALSAVHGARLAHGDLRPSNIFLCGEPGAESPEVKILDLWMARCFDADLADSLGLSAPWYKSPEELASRRASDMRGDLWALGVLLFEMLTGQRPWTGTKDEAIEKIKSGSIPRVSAVVSDVDPALEEIVARCLERERDKRISSAMVVAHMLEVFTGPRVSKPMANGASGANGPQTATVTLDTGPRGQLGTLVMAEGAPLSEPSSSTPASTPMSTPLGTMVMGPGGPAPASAPASSSGARPLEALQVEARAPEPTQVFSESYPPPPAVPEVIPGPGRVAGPFVHPTLLSARAPAPTVVDPPQSSSRMLLIVALIAGVVFLVGVFVILVLL